ncbi:MAG: dihydroorotate dehydrogenase electron transfer subunit [Isosphaeraceae bacterium]
MTHDAAAARTDLGRSNSPFHRRATIVENIPVARDTYRIRLADAAIAGSIRPGQFVMVRPVAGEENDPLLGRPLALYDLARDASGTPVAFDLVYLVIGRGTAALARCQPGESLPVWGPLGNGFGPAPSGPVVFVAGGIGQTPFLALGREWLNPGTDGRKCPSATILYGVRTKSLLAGVEDFRSAGIEVELATDDGSAGHHGFVTELLARRLDRGEIPARIVACGPPAMLASVARIAEQHGVDCEVSLENHMACGFGACFSCVAPIRQPDGTVDLRRVCVEGPVFSARSVAWGG